jgi:hypothetical protein
MGKRQRKEKHSDPGDQQPALKRKVYNANNYPPAVPELGWGWVHDPNIDDVLRHLLDESGIQIAHLPTDINAASTSSNVISNGYIPQSSILQQQQQQQEDPYAFGMEYNADLNRCLANISAECRKIEEDEKNKIIWRDEDRPLYDVFLDHSDQVAGGVNAYGGLQRDYRLRKIDRQEFKRFGAERARYELVIEPPDPKNVLSYYEEMENLHYRLQSVINDVQNTSEPQDWFGLTVNNPNFRTGAVWITARRADQLDADAMLSAFDRIFQSYDMTLFQDLFTLTTIKIRMPNGGRSKRRTVIGGTLTEFLKSKKRSLIFINNQDDICMARAIVIAKAHADGDRALCDSLQVNRKLQQDMARRLHFNAGVPERSCTLDDLKKFADHLPEYRFMVRDMFDFLHKDPVEKTKNIILFYDSGQKHYHVLTSLKGFLATSYFCIECNARYNNKTAHKCKRGCKACGGGEKDCVKYESSISCADCNRFFYNTTCYGYHKSHNLCENLFRCKLCNTLVCRKKRCTNLRRMDGVLLDHLCGEIYCTVCKGHYLNPHLCYMQPVYDDDDDNVQKTRKRKNVKMTEDDPMTSFNIVEEREQKNADQVEKKKKFLYAFYDFETTQESKVEGTMQTYEHVVNYAVVKQRCADCISINNIEHCGTCGVRKHIYSGKDTLDEFCNYVFKLQASNKFVVTAIAHNSSGYDAQFVLQRCFIHGVKPERFVASGTKIMSMTVYGVKFVDSFKFMPMALSKLPDAFGLAQLKKGDFPHLFNKSENQDYVGPIPEFKYYGPDTRSLKEREKLFCWWKQQQDSNYVFDFQKELQAYCESDVEILEQACLKFRELFLRDDVDPFLCSTTIASACSLLFRKKFLEPKTIGIMNPKGYAFRDTQSHIALMWLYWEEKERGIRIQHAANGREVNLMNRFKVDGYNEKERIVFEFHGCAFHGCHHCYRTPSARKKLVPMSSNRTLDDAYEDTAAKVSALRTAGFQVVEKWECEFRRELKSNEQLAQFWEDHLETQPINPRDAFFGGRTNAVRMFYKTDPGLGDKVSYVDVCSLYPWVNKYGKYPIGHPRIETSNLTTDIDGYEGLIKCTILPPSNLFHPVLPARIAKKLMFPLCAACAKLQPQKDRCKHTVQERALTGTWVSDELKKAVEKGYTVLKVIEVWQFDEVRHGFFRDYIDHFLKLKSEASGYPVGVVTDEEKDAYIQRYYEREGIMLNKTHIECNPGLRTIAKLALNSFWGKFGQRNNLDQLEYITHPEQLRAYLLDETKEIVSLCFPSEEIAQVQWRNGEDFIEPTITGNPFIAAYTTAQARLKLYSYLEALDRRVLYFDTDSVIYVTEPGQSELPTGEFLGDLTDEIAVHGSGSYINEFVSAGPKNYAYTVVNVSGQQVGGCCKVKGLTLNSKNAANVNFESMKRMVINSSRNKTSGGKEEEEEKVVMTDMRISRTKEHQVVTRPEKKTWRVVYNKRQLQSDLSTLPWGYK